jgi:hypothetical protein
MPDAGRRPTAAREHGAAGIAMISITVNGKVHRLDVEPECRCFGSSATNSA